MTPTRKTLPGTITVLLLLVQPSDQAKNRSLQTQPNAELVFERRISHLERELEQCDRESTHDPVDRLEADLHEFPTKQAGHRRRAAQSLGGIVNGTHDATIPGLCQDFPDRLICQGSGGFFQGCSYLSKKHAREYCKGTAFLPLSCACPYTCLHTCLYTWLCACLCACRYTCLYAHVCTHDCTQALRWFG